MKAIVLQQTGGVENLVAKEVPTPAIKDNEVLIRNKAISINPVDNYVRAVDEALKAYVRPTAGEDIILGWDIAGEVVATGKAVTHLKTGDTVFGMVNFPGHGKAYAEYVAAPENQLALKPAGTTFEEAAAATLAALTAWQALVTYGQVKKGDSVLIHSAAGGVGHYAIQIAKHFGAHVIASASPAKKTTVLELGADEHVDYTQQPFETVVKDIDLVIDTQAIPGHLERSLSVLKNGGRLISLLGNIDEALQQKAAARNIYTHRLVVHSNGEDMKSIAALMERGELRSIVAQTFEFEEMGKAHMQVATGKTQGKLVVRV